MHVLVESKAGKGAAALAFTAALAVCLSFPALAFAEVDIDGTAIGQGENAVGGGTATLTETVLDMVNVVADSMTITNESLTVNFNGGNKMDQRVVVEGSSDVTVNFAGDNDVEDFTVKGSSSLTVNADGHDDLEELYAYDDANLIVNVTGENDFEEIVGFGNANITIRGTDCQKKDIVNIEDDEQALLKVENGNLTIDHVTVNLEGDERGIVGSDGGDVVIDTSKIKAGDDVWSWIKAGGTLRMSESVIEIAGEVFSRGTMIIAHSDVEVGKAKAAKEVLPYRVFSHEGIKLIDEKNGEVREGEYKDEKVWYVDTDDNDGSEVDLEADGEPGYYKCKSSTKGIPKTGDGSALPALALLALASLLAVPYAARRREDGVA